MKLPNIRYHEQILFVFSFGIILYGAFVQSENSVRNYKRGLQAGAFILVCEGVLKNYKGPFVRPNLAFWRGMARICLVYLIALVFLVYQNENDARNLMKHLYPELGKPVPGSMHTYDDNCEFQFKNIYENLDHYFAIHVINWFVASLIVRDHYVLMTWSIADEIIELSWQHILPHFRECWWDHIILDLILSNTPAILLGMTFVKKCGLQPYDWLGRFRKKSIKDWDIFKCHRRFGTLLAIAIIMNFNFLTGFFLINSLWIPPINNLNLFRLAVWFVLANLTFREAYTDVITWGTELRKKHPISGKMRWMLSGILFLEVLCSYKFRHNAGNTLQNPWPLYISVPWLTLLFVCVIYYLYLRFKPNHSTKYPKSTKNHLTTDEDDLSSPFEDIKQKKTK